MHRAARLGRPSSGQSWDRASLAGEPPLQLEPRARAPAQSSRNVQLAYLLCHARSVACACWMEVARPGFEPRACRDTFEPSSFERRAVTPLGQVYVTCTVACAWTSELRVRSHVLGPRSSGCGGRAAGGVRELGAFDDASVDPALCSAARSERAQRRTAHERLSDALLARSCAW